METITVKILLSSLTLLSLFLTNLGFNLYHIFLHKEKERSFRLLNVFYGYLAVGWQLESFVNAILILIRNDVLYIENDYFCCILENTIIVRGYSQNLIFLAIGILTVLNHFQPSLYLHLSIKLGDAWKLPHIVSISLLLHAAISTYFSGEPFRCNDSNKDLLIWSSISSLTTTLLLKCSVLMSSLSTFYGIDFNRLRPLDWKKKGSRVEPVDHSPPSHSTQTKHHLVSPSTGFISILLIISIALTLLIFLKIWGPVFFPQTLYFSMNFLVMPAISLIWVLKDESLRRFAFSIVSPC